MIGLTLTLALCAVAQDETAAEDYRGYLDQARFFIRKGWFDDAEKQLELAVAHPDGWVDPEAWFMLATVRYELLDIEGAREAGSRAHTYSRDDDQLAQAAGFSAFVHEQFGVVVIKAPYEGLTGRLAIEITSMLFDPNQKEFLEKVADHFKKKVLFPQRFGLPVGSYTINGQEVEVVADKPRIVALPANELGSKGPAAVKLVQAELGVGVANWIGSSVAQLRPSFDGQLSVSLPAGPLRIAAVFDWIPTGYGLLDGTSHTNVAGGSLGLQVGYAIPGTDPILIRTALGYRYGLVPGMELTCTGGEDGSFACGDGVDTDIVVYAVGSAHIPYLEVSIGHLDERRTSDIGFGVKGVLEYGLGTLPAEGTALVLEDGSSIPFTTDPDSRPWSALGLRVLAHLSVAF